MRPVNSHKVLTSCPPSRPGLLDRNDILTTKPARTVKSGAHLACPGQPLFLTDTEPTKEGLIVLPLVIHLWSTVIRACQGDRHHGWRERFGHVANAQTI